MKVLLVEDDPVARLVLARMLTERGYELTACASATDAMNALQAAFYPLIFLDLHLPGGVDGFSFCRWIREQPDGDRPLILIGTGSARPGDLQRILEAGADDYITKPYQAGLLDVRLAIARKRVRNIETRKRLEANLREERERLRYLATHDPLTKLANRAVFIESLKSAVEASRNGTHSALLYLDLDNFKVINDSLGHAVGDKVLSEIATALRKSVRAQDVPFRLGGDEFAILLRELKLPEAKAIAERIQSRIEECAYSEAGKVFTVGTSIGIAAIEGAIAENDVMAFADSACYSAKAHGRNRIVIYDANDALIAEMHRQKPQVAEINEAIRRQRFEIMFQPVVDLKTGCAAHYEVLVRLPSNGRLLLPGAFLPTAERLQLMPKIDRQVITKALPHLAADRALTLAINLSGQSFSDETLPDFIQASLKHAGIPPDHVIFEITETAVISNVSAARAMMKQLRGAGFRFSLDDFGAGFSSFSYLKDLIADYLKIDGSFIRGAESDRSSWIFVEMMNDIAHRLKIRSIAEFVEHESTVVALREIGVDFAQGHFFGEPARSPMPLSGMSR